MKRVFLLLLFLSLSCSALAQKDSKTLPKLSADEIVAKHLASIGSPAGLSAVKSRVLVGTGAFTSASRPGKVGGPTQLAATGDMFLLAIMLNANNYPYEKLAYDGRNLTYGVLPAGGPSPLGDFLKSHKVIVTRGFLGGVLSQSWPLLTSSKEVKLEARGTEKVGDRTLYKLRASSSGMGEMTVSLYFEPETFRHVRTEYFYRTGQLTTPNPGPSVTGEVRNAGGTSPGTYTLTEDFSNFAKVESIVLPLNYVIEYTTDIGKPLTWTMTFSQAFLNEKLEPGVFKVS